MSKEGGDTPARPAAVEKQTKLESSDVQQARNASGQSIAATEGSRTNASDGGHGDSMNSATQKEKKLCWLTLVVLADKALLPTSVKTDQGNFAVEPIREIDYKNREALINALVEAIRVGNPLGEAPPLENQSKRTPLEVRANATSWADLERKSIYFSIMVYPSNVRLEAWGRASNKTWSDEKQTVLDVKIPAAQGIEAVADAILEHLRIRKDLPGMT